jgi:glyoxylate reductase
MKPKVFVTRIIPRSGIDLLEQYCQVKVSVQDRVIAKDELLDGVKWCDALLCLLTDRIDEEVIAANPNLKVIANYAVGYDNIDLKAATAANIPVTNTPDILTDAVAEHTFALLMAIARRIPESDKYTRLGKYKGWAPMLFLGAELKGKTLGIIGLGRIGIGVAQRAKAMGMNILYHDINRDGAFEKTYQAGFADTDSIIKESDFISIHVPLLPLTKHLIGQKQLAMMKKTAYLINTSRGPVVDEKALVEALASDEIAGAALDVFEFEPDLSAGLAQMDNVVLTPHTASATHETRSAMSMVAASNILDVLRGEVPRNLVNKDVEASLSREPIIN